MNTTEYRIPDELVDDILSYLRDNENLIHEWSLLTESIFYFSVFDALPHPTGRAFLFPGIGLS